MNRVVAFVREEEEEASAVAAAPSGVVIVALDATGSMSNVIGQVLRSIKLTITTLGLIPNIRVYIAIYKDYDVVKYGPMISIYELRTCAKSTALCDKILSATAAGGGGDEEECVYTLLTYVCANAESFTGGLSESVVPMLVINFSDADMRLPLCGRASRNLVCEMETVKDMLMGGASPPDARELASEMRTKCVKLVNVLTHRNPTPMFDSLEMAMSECGDVDGVVNLTCPSVLGCRKGGEEIVANTILSLCAFYLIGQSTNDADSAAVLGHVKALPNTLEEVGLAWATVFGEESDDETLRSLLKDMKTRCHLLDNTSVSRRIGKDVFIDGGRVLLFPAWVSGTRRTATSLVDAHIRSLYPMSETEYANMMMERVMRPAFEDEKIGANILFKQDIFVSVYNKINQAADAQVKSRMNMLLSKASDTTRTAFKIWKERRHTNLSRVSVVKNVFYHPNVCQALSGVLVVNYDALQRTRGPRLLSAGSNLLQIGDGKNLDVWIEMFDKHISEISYAEWYRLSHGVVSENSRFTGIPLIANEEQRKVMIAEVTGSETLCPVALVGTLLDTRLNLTGMVKCVLAMLMVLAEKNERIPTLKRLAREIVGKELGDNFFQGGPLEEIPSRPKSLLPKPHPLILTHSVMNTMIKYLDTADDILHCHSSFLLEGIRCLLTFVQRHSAMMRLGEGKVETVRGANVYVREGDSMLQCYVCGKLKSKWCQYSDRLIADLRANVCHKCAIEAVMARMRAGQTPSTVPSVLQPLLRRLEDRLAPSSLQGVLPSATGASVYNDAAMEEDSPSRNVNTQPIMATRNDKFVGGRYGKKRVKFNSEVVVFATNPFPNDSRLVYTRDELASLRSRKKRWHKPLPTLSSPPPALPPKNLLVSLSSETVERREAREHFIQCGKCKSFYDVSKLEHVPANMECHRCVLCRLEDAMTTENNSDHFPLGSLLQRSLSTLDEDHLFVYFLVALQSGGVLCSDGVDLDVKRLIERRLAEIRRKQTVTCRKCRSVIWSLGLKSCPRCMPTKRELSLRRIDKLASRVLPFSAFPLAYEMMTGVKSPTATVTSWTGLTSLPSLHSLLLNGSLSVSETYFDVYLTPSGALPLRLTPEQIALLANQYPFRNVECPVTAWTETLETNSPWKCSICDSPYQLKCDGGRLHDWKNDPGAPDCNLCQGCGYSQAKDFVNRCMLLASGSLGSCHLDCHVCMCKGVIKFERLAKALLNGLRASKVVTCMTSGAEELDAVEREKRERETKRVLCLIDSVYRQRQKMLESGKIQNEAVLRLCSMCERLEPLDTDGPDDSPNDNDNDGGMECCAMGADSEQQLEEKFVCQRCKDKGATSMSSAVVKLLRDASEFGHVPSPEQENALGETNVLYVTQTGEQASLEFSEALRACYRYRRSVECHLPKVVPCPGCTRDIAKESGCHNVTCTVCKTNFCWICSFASEDSRHVYAHLKVKHGLSFDILDSEKCLRWNAVTEYLQMEYLYVLVGQRKWNNELKRVNGEDGDDIYFNGHDDDDDDDMT